jgi:signal transduction histidine kinase
MTSTYHNKPSKQWELTELMFEQSELAAGIGSFIFVPNTRELHCSRGMHRIYQTDPGSDTTTPGTVAQFGSLETAVLIHFQTHGLGSAASDYEADLELETARGNRIWVHMACRAERREGRVIRIVGSLQDITERKKVEDALRESEQFVHATLDALSAHLAILNEKGTIIAVNTAWRQFAEANGVASNDVSVGVNYLAVCDAATGRNADGAAEFAAGIRAVIDGKQNTYTQEYPCHAPSELRWFVGLVTHFSVRGTAYVVVSHENITQRKLAEAALMESLQRFEMLADHLTAARENERTLIAREVHDELGQVFTALKMELMTLLRKTSKNLQEIPPRAYSIMQMIEAGIKSVQQISSSLRPRILDDLGLISAIEWEAEEFQKRTEIPVTLALPNEDVVIQKDVSTAVFRVIQESLTNIGRHAAATRISIELRVEPERLVFTIQDNGVGISGTALADKNSFGLIGMRERLRMLGGQIEFFNNTESGGMSVWASIPLREPKEHTER